MTALCSHDEKISIVPDDLLDRVRWADNGIFTLGAEHIMCLSCATLCQRPLTWQLRAPVRVSL